MKPEPEPEDFAERLEECIESASSFLANLSEKPANKKENVQKEFTSGLQPIISKMQQGMTLILEFLTSPSSHDPMVFSEEITRELCQIAAIASVMGENPKEYLLLLAKDKTLQDIFGLTQETMERLYQAAKFIYEQQHYQEAAATFAVLSVIDPTNYTFWVGFGNSEYFCHNYQSALVAYAMAAQANPLDPLCHFYSAHCYEALKHKEHAINSLDLAILSIGDKPEFSHWKQKAVEHKQRLSKQS
jgi:type III secretion system low calcium response chaperone LcrH/SycD